MFRKTKIICTLGPSSESYETMLAMAKAGMNVARFNMAHTDYETGAKRMATVKKVREDLNIPLATMVDIKGPEVRTGRVDTPIKVKIDDVIIFTGEQIAAHDNIVPINYPDIAKDVYVGGHILLNDGILDMVIEKIEDV